MRSLAFPGMDDRSHDIDNAAASTCNWIFQHHVYKKWVDADKHRLLRITGIPRSGKSTLLRHMYRNLQASLSDAKSSVVVSFFFHGRGCDLQKSRLGFFRSLCHQILAIEPRALSNLVKELERKKITLGADGGDWDWHVNELAHFFKAGLQTIPQRKPVWFFADALDECGRQEAVHLVEYIKDLIQSNEQSSHQMRVCFSCRKYPSLGINPKSVVCMEQENRDDTSTFVR